MDIEKINEILDKYPALIYYEIHENCERQTLLLYGLYHCNVDMMQCALNHSEKFDDPKLNINSSFLHPFFNRVPVRNVQYLLFRLLYRRSHD